MGRLTGKPRCRNAEYSGRLVEENNEYFGPVKVLKTNQKDPSKFLLASVQALKTGFAGQLGSIR